MRTTLTRGVDWKVSPQYLSQSEIGYLSRVRDGHAVASTAGRKGPLGAMENPSWSPDGTVVVYSKLVRGTAPGAVPLVTSHDKDSQFVNGTEPFSVRYSLDGSRLVWATNAGQQHAIEMMNVDGSHR